MLRGIPASAAAFWSLSCARTGAHPKASATNRGRPHTFKALGPIAAISLRETTVGQRLLYAFLRRFDARTVNRQSTGAHRQQYYESEQQLPTHQDKSPIASWPANDPPPLWRNWYRARKSYWRKKAKEV
jgi:hypothetical protein